MKEDLEGEFVLDTGVLVEILQGNLDELYGSIKRSDVIPYISRLTTAEVRYVLCRKFGDREAGRLFELFLGSNLFIIMNPEEIFDLSSELKCRFAIALADCFSIALGIYMHIPVLMREEKEIRKIMENGFDDAKIIMVEWRLSP